MSDFEDRIGRAFEGGFARVFRAPVQPAELARKLGKEMDRGKKLGVGKVYAPTLYSILLSRQDDASLGGFADTLAGELETYLVGYARERDYTLATRPVVRFLIDKELKLGRFEIIGELLSPEELAEELGYTPDQEPYATPRDPGAAAAIPAPAPAAPVASSLPVAPGVSIPAAAIPAPTPPAAAPAPFQAAGPGIFDADDVDFGATAAPESAADAMPAPAANPTQVLGAVEPPTPPIATVTVRGVDHDVVLTGPRVVVGRLQTCDISLTDVNVSREHAAFEREGLGWAIRDLGSTNGTLVNGERVTRQRLRDGDTIVIGITELIYHEPRG